MKPGEDKYLSSRFGTIPFVLSATVSSARTNGNRNRRHRCVRSNIEPILATEEILRKEKRPQRSGAAKEAREGGNNQN